MNKKLLDRASQRLRVVDSLGKETGAFALRSECHLCPGIKHLAFIVFVVNSKNEFALHKRHVSKVGEGLLDSPVSHVLAGESLEEAVHRCLLSEYGIKGKLQIAKHGAFSYMKEYPDGTCENEYCLVLSVEFNGKIAPNPVEIEGGIIHMLVKKAILESSQAQEMFEAWFKLAIPVFAKSGKAKKFLQ